MTEERKQLHLKFVALLSDVAAQLGKLGEGDVRFEDGSSPDDYRSYGRLVHSEFVLSVVAYRDGYSAKAKERVKFSGSWPRPAGGAYKGLRDYGLIDYNKSEPEISVSIDGTAERIAKDVQRRLIKGEDIRGLYAKVLARQASDAAYANRKDVLAKELFALAGEKPRKVELDGGRTPTVNLYEFAPGVSYGDVQIRGDDTVRFELTVNGALAKRLLGVLVQLKEGS